MPVHAFIFPGQGSQSVGMGRDLAAAFAAAREVFQEVDDVLEQKLSKLMFEGPGRRADPDREHPAGADGDVAGGAAGAGDARAAFRWRRRRCSSPAIRWANTAPWRPPAAFPSPMRPGCCGCAARRCRRRCRAGEGAMAALLGVEIDQAGAICEEAALVPDSVTEEHPNGIRQVVEPANDNGGGQVVISGASRGGGARDRGGQGARRAPGDAAAGLRAVPLRADGAGGRRHGRGVRADPAGARRWCR